jgi:hypothetical protein
MEGLTSETPRELAEDQKIALWKKLFDKDLGAPVGTPHAKFSLVPAEGGGTQGHAAAQLAFYSTPIGGFLVVLVAPNGVDLTAADIPTANALAKDADGWSTFLRPGEYVYLEQKAGEGYQVA